MPFPDGPYVSTALFCERVLTEEDQVLSHIRVVDRVIGTAVGDETPANMPDINWHAFFVLTLKSGKAKGRHEVMLTLEKPNGEMVPGLRNDVLFEGEERGVSVVSNLQIKFTLEGLYWMHAYVDGEEITRSPLRVVYQRSTKP